MPLDIKKTQKFSSQEKLRAKNFVVSRPELKKKWSKVLLRDKEAIWDRKSCVSYMKGGRMPDNKQTREKNTF